MYKLIRILECYGFFNNWSLPFRWQFGFFFHYLGFSFIFLGFSFVTIKFWILLRYIKKKDPKFLPELSFVFEKRKFVSEKNKRKEKEKARHGKFSLFKRSK